MMESELNNQDDLIQQLKKLQAENKLLEKHVFVLNECLSVNELKEKISILEEKKEKINSLEDMIGRLRAEIEPLKYLKSVLENKLINENKTVMNKPLTNIDLNPVCTDNLNELNTECKTSQSQHLKTIPTNSTNDGLLNTPDNSNAISKTIASLNDGSLDECIQLLDQYDVVTDLEISNFPEKDHSKIQNVTEEPSICVNVDIDNEVKGKQLSMMSTYFDAEIAEGLNMQLNNEGNESVKMREKSNESIKNVNYNTTLLADDRGEITQTKEVYFKRFEEETTHTKESVEQLKQMEQIELPIAASSITTIDSFNDMNLKIDILRGIYSLGFTDPTTLQKQVIVNCLNGRDVIVSAGPGNGRIIMFTIALLQRIKTNLYKSQALVLVPTRDLALHIQKIILSVGDFMEINVCIGGDNFPKKLSVIPHIIVGTPDGVYNMFECKSLRPKFIQTVVINKIDEMLNDGYTKLIKQIMRNLPKKKQVTILASEKLDYVLDMYMDSLLDPLIIFSEDENEINIIKSLPKQFYFAIEEDWKLTTLCEFIETLDLQRIIIFCNSFDRARKLSDSLTRLDLSVSHFHSEMNATEREVILNMFYINDLQMLVTTDPMKGMQFKNAAWIINFDLPTNPSSYLSRVGKCAKQAKVINLIDENELNTKLMIEKYNNSYMIPTPVNLIDILEY